MGGHLLQKDPSCKHNSQSCKHIFICCALICNTHCNGFFPFWVGGRLSHLTCSVSWGPAGAPQRLGGKLNHLGRKKADSPDKSDTPSELGSGGAARDLVRRFFTLGCGTLTPSEPRAGPWPLRFLRTASYCFRFFSYSCFLSSGTQRRETIIITKSICNALNFSTINA